MKRKIIVWLWIVPAAVAFAVYWNAFSNGFIWDDSVVLKNQLIAFRSPKDLLLPPPGIPHFGIHYYRPLIIASFILDRELWGNSPFGFHLSVILVHIANTILVYFLARSLLKKDEYAVFGAFVSSLLFAVHPIHTESVSWIAGRSDVIAALFLFISILLFLKYQERKNVMSGSMTRTSLLLFSSLSFFLSACAKETGLALVLILPALELSDGQTETDGLGSKGRRAAKRIIPYIPFLAFAAIYLSIRQYAMRNIVESAFQLRSAGSALKDFINAFGFYIGRLILPVRLSAYIPEVPGGLFLTLFSLAALLALIVSAGYALKRKNRVIFFSILYFLATLLPSALLAILKAAETPLAERYLYIPSFSLSLVVGSLLLSLLPGRDEQLRFRKTISFIVILILALIVGAWSSQTVIRNGVWRNDIRFWEDIAQKSPDFGLPHLNLGVAYREANRTEEAEEEYRKAAEAHNNTDEGRAIAYSNLGNIHTSQGDYDLGEEYIRKAISIKPDYATSYYGLALTYWKRYVSQREKGQAVDESLPQKAVDALKRAIQLNPQFVLAHALLGQIYYKFQYYDEAVEHLKTVLTYEQSGKAAEAARQMLGAIPEK